MEESIFPSEVKNLMEKLTFIGKIPRGSKVNLRDMSFAENASPLSSMKRLLFCENRRELINFINICISEANTLLLESPSNVILIDYLIKSKEGISSLMVTYREDAHTVSKLEVSSKHIDLIISSYKSKKRLSLEDN